MLSKVPTHIPKSDFENRIVWCYFLVLESIESDTLCMQGLKCCGLHMVCVPLSDHEFLLRGEVVHEKGKRVYTRQFATIHLL